MDVEHACTLQVTDHQKGQCHAHDQPSFTTYLPTVVQVVICSNPGIRANHKGNHHTPSTRIINIFDNIRDVSCKEQRHQQDSPVDHHTQGTGSTVALHLQKGYIDRCRHAGFGQRFSVIHNGDCLLPASLRTSQMDRRTWVYTMVYLLLLQTIQWHRVQTAGLMSPIQRMACSTMQHRVCKRCQCGHYWESNRQLFGPNSQW